MAVSYREAISGATRLNDDGSQTLIKLSSPLYQEVLDWINDGNTLEPMVSVADQAQIDYEGRQAARIANLKSALINQFKMILELFQVGRDKGLWVVADFDPALVTLAQEWKDLIDDYEADSP